VAKTKKKDVKTWRFYRSNKETIVWDPENDGPLVEFVGGQFYTDDSEIAERLIELGYPEVPLDAIHPPDIMFGKGVIFEGDVAILPKNITADAALANEKAKRQQELMRSRVRALSEKSPVPERVKKKSTKAAAKKKTAKKKKKSNDD
jgi:hypothetical protein